jgi:hypothetical protein
MRRELQFYTCMEPAPSMAEVCRKLGLKPLTTHRKFPAEYWLIVSQVSAALQDDAPTATDWLRLRPFWLVGPPNPSSF